MEMVCIVCPQGCHLTVQQQPDGIQVSGNSCPRGAKFAEAELTHPTRSLTTTVATTLPGVPVLPVRTDGEVPKEMLAQVMQACNSFLLTHAVCCGDVLLPNVCNTGCSIIATRTAQGGAACRSR